jgi:hypothetical protein
MGIHMSMNRATRVLATMAVAAAGVVSVAPTAGADENSVTIVASCSGNEVNVTHTIIVRADGSWEQRMRAHNGAGLRRHVQVTSELFPNSAGGASAGTFTSTEKTLGTGLFDEDTKRWTNTGSNPGWIPWFGDLRSGGRVASSCRIDSNWTTPANFDRNENPNGTWAPQ